MGNVVLDMSLVAACVQGVLGVLLATAAWMDVRTHRIPNRLILIGLVVGLCANGLLPLGFGFNSWVEPGGRGWLLAFEGAVLGLLLLLPFYLLRAMGAGDVKLMAMVGAFVGPGSVMGVVLFTFVAGGLLAVAMMLRARMLPRLMQNARLMVMESMAKISVREMPVVEVAESAGKLPYGVSIAVGTAAWLMYERIAG